MNVTHLKLNNLRAIRTAEFASCPAWSAPMNRRLTAIIEREGNGYVALCPEVDVVSQGDTVAEARGNLEKAVTLFFETASAEEIADRLRDEVYVTQVEVAVG